jgi:glutamine synthetase
VLKEIMTLHGNVIFGGDGYSSEWHKMAVEERGLKNIPTTADALLALHDKAIVDLFENTGVLSPVELESRFEVYSEQYILSIEVEARLVVDLASTRIYPAAMKYMSDLAETAKGMAELEIDLDSSTVKQVAVETNSMMSAVKKLGGMLIKDDFESADAHMKFCAETIRPLMDEVRVHADTLEGLVADDLWPLPKYQEMLFIK